MSTIWLVRHGQASAGADDYDALSALGERQAHALGLALAARAFKPDLIVAGALRRHRQTATVCLDALGVAPRWQEDAGWNEYDHNDVFAACDPRHRHQGALAEDLALQENPRVAFQSVFAVAMERWINADQDDDEYVESWNAFHARVAYAFGQLCERLGRGRSALVFTSGGVISSVCRGLLNLGDEQTVSLNRALANASLTRVIAARDGARLATFNEYAHLETHGSGSVDGLLSYL